MSETKKIQGDEDPLVDMKTMTDRMMGYFNAVLQLTEDYARMAKRIAELVNRWVQEKRISDYGYSRKGALWDILYRAGLYSKSRQNWNRRVV